jgi:NADH-quinone oxidoreductase subunit A
MAYECGANPIGEAGARFSVKFHLVAMLFILFDIEVVFLYPIAVQLKAYGGYALAETITFIVLLMVAFVYVWRRGALEWR